MPYGKKLKSNLPLKPKAQVALWHPQRLNRINGSKTALGLVLVIHLYRGAKRLGFDGVGRGS
jgi:hypothetical protein